MPGERLVDVAISLTGIAVPLYPTCTVAAVATVVIRTVSVVSGTAAERRRIDVISVAPSEVGLFGLVTAIVRTRASPGPTTRLDLVALIITVPVRRVVIVTWVEVHFTHLPTCALHDNSSPRHVDRWV